MSFSVQLAPSRLRKITYFVLSLCLGGNLQDAQTCGLVGYVGPLLCKEFVLDGLAHLEYRGYDSAGFCCLDPSRDSFTIIKSEGKLSKLKEKAANIPYDGCTGMGHTRWATHGPASVQNAHPHTDCHNTVAVAHNGIIENYSSLRNTLIRQGHAFRSDTDTEVVAHLFRTLLNEQTATDAKTILKQATQALVHQLEGSFSLIIMLQDYPDIMIAVRCNSPLTIGMGEGEKYIASDVIAYVDKVTDVLFVPNKSYAIITQDTVALYDFSGDPLKCEITTVPFEATTYTKMGNEHYMLKEIYEQPHIIQQQIRTYQELGDTIFEQFGISKQEARALQSLHILGCGSSWHAGLIGEFFFASITGIPTHVHLSSEFRYKPLFAEDNTLYVAISQSGETADTLESVRLAKQYSFPVATITNVSSSSMVRETDGYIETMAGPEISVASTKAFTTSVVALYWLAHMIAKEKGLITQAELDQAAQNLLRASSVLAQSIEMYQEQIQNSLAPICSASSCIMCLGRHNSYPLALEGALKLKEITYISTHGGAAGELKHGTLALIDQATPVIILSHLDPTLYKKTVSNAQEVKARKGTLIAIAFENQDELIKLADQAIILPRTDPLLAPLAMCGILQCLAYEIAKQLGRDIDKPRNLAKSVTVE